jgi:hypothetical protein
MRRILSALRERYVEIPFWRFIATRPDMYLQVLEETGFDITPYLEPENYIEITLREQRIRLYIICGVSEDSEFIPRTRKEISVCSSAVMNACFYGHTNRITVSNSKSLGTN